MRKYRPNDFKYARYIIRNSIYFLLIFVCSGYISIYIATSAKSENAADRLYESEVHDLCFDYKELLPKSYAEIKAYKNQNAMIKIINERNASVKIRLRRSQSSFISSIEINKKSAEIKLSNLLNKDQKYINSEFCQSAIVGRDNLKCSLLDTEEVEFLFIERKSTKITVRCGAFAD